MLSLSPQFLLLLTSLNLLFVSALVPTPGNGASTLPGSTFAPNVSSTGSPASWDASVLRARQFVSSLTLPEKINLTTGIDIFGPCVGNTGAVPRIGFKGLCLQDSPLGVRLTDGVSAFPAGINAAMTFDKDLIKARGVAMGSEFRGRGVNVALGPMMNMGRVAPGGRNWEGFGGDPFLTGVASSLTVQGIQSQGVIACAKHFVANEQEHMRGGSGASETAQTYSSELSTRTLREIYVWPFQESIHAGVASVMCAYNRINDQWACESDLLGHVLKDELDFKGTLISDWAALVSGIPPALAGVDLNMPGFVGYGNGPQDEEDPSVATNSFWGKALLDSVNNGSVPAWRVDDMVVRTMSAFFQLGQDKGFPAISTGLNPSNPSVQGNHATLIRQMGAASVVLLKQSPNSPLPFTKSGGPGPRNKLPKSIAVLGSDAGPNPDGPNGCQNGNTDHGCSQGTLAQGWGSGTAEFPYLIDPLAALTSWFKTNNPSTSITSSLNDFDLGTAANLASGADVTMVFVNADSGEQYINVDGNQGDRNNLTLWHGGDALIQAATSHSSNVIVVIHAVGPVLLESFIDNPNVTAVLFAGLPGQESGNGLMDVLSGAVNPSGRLPFTMAKDPNDYPAQIVFNPAFPGQVVVPIPYTEGLQIDYRWFDAKNIQPRFEFGFGKSFTTFQYSSLNVFKAGLFAKRDELVSIDIDTGIDRQPVPDHNHKPPPLPTSDFPKPTVNPHPPPPPFPIPPINAPKGSVGGNPQLFQNAITVSFNVRNTGGSDGNEVPQVYLGYPDSAGEPPRILRGFEKVFVRRGGSERVSVDLRMWDLTIWDESRNTWVIPRGNFKVFVGASSRDIRLTGGFSVGRDVVIPASG